MMEVADAVRGDEGGKGNGGDKGKLHGGNGKERRWAFGVSWDVGAVENGEKRETDGEDESKRGEKRARRACVEGAFEEIAFAGDNICKQAGATLCHSPSESSAGHGAGAECSLQK